MRWSHNMDHSHFTPCSRVREHRKRLSQHPWYGLWMKHKGPQGKPNDPWIPIYICTFHPRCRCISMNDSQWSILILNLDENYCSNCHPPCITSTYVWSLLSAKGQRTLLMKLPLEVWDSWELPFIYRRYWLGLRNYHRLRLGFEKLPFRYRRYWLSLRNYRRLRLGIWEITGWRWRLCRFTIIQKSKNARWVAVLPGSASRREATFHS